MKKLVIIGAGGFGREVLELVQNINENTIYWELMGFIDDNYKEYNLEVNGLKVLGNIDHFIKEYSIDFHYVIAIGDPKIKQKTHKKLSQIGFIGAILIHPSVKISKFVKINEGSIIYAGTILTTNIEIGKHVQLNLSTTVGHDTIIDDYTSIQPGVNVSGNVKIQKGVYIGTGAKIINNLKIEEWAVIGAAAAVINNIPQKTTAVGVPTKVIS